MGDRSDAALQEDTGRRIRRLRGKLGLTQVQFAELMGVSFASVNRWENGQSRPSPLAWQRILATEEHGLDALLHQPGAASRAHGHTNQAATVPNLDFSADPEIVRAVAEAERLSYGHIFNPAFATEISRIDPLPHQRIAVYQHLLSQPRLRFLMADDAGAGKTIMAGLYIREMLTRRLIRRVLVVPPAGLIGNWESELRTLFGLRFKIVTGLDVRAGNPFVGPDGDLVIVSVDTMTGDRMLARLREPDVAPYDLAIFDEAHKLSARLEDGFTFRRTGRYKLAEALAGVHDVDPPYRLPWSCRHLLLLTATPHMGKDFPYYCLWRLLEPEVLSTKEAFDAFPPEARREHFIRRTKEEMVRLDGSRIFPPRKSDTLSYQLSQGEVSEQALYDRTTDYMRDYYNRARILNRSAARLAMSVFQRRLASSTYALMRSFERRLAKLDALIEDVRAGRLTTEQLLSLQERLRVRDIENDKTADEEEAEDGLEENEAAELEAMAGVVGVTLGELEAERNQVRSLLDLARKVYERGEDSKFEKLREVIRDPQWRDQKILVFTEHRDTLDFIVQTLEGMGFAGRVARIHGAMDYLERQQQVAFFDKPTVDGGAAYMICTDAAAEGINLQRACWLMVNYDIPWNPARLEQRMGRIHRYKQTHEVRIINLVAGRTREGRVLKTLLDKLEKIRKELNSDKVFDVIGRLFEDLSLKDYLEKSVTDQGATESVAEIEGKLTPEQIRAFQEWERKLYGEGGEVAARLDTERAIVSREQLRRLLPGYVRSFVERAAPLLGLRIEGDLDGVFSFAETRPRALEPFWPILEDYPPQSRNRFTLHNPGDSIAAIFLHPGELFFDTIREAVLSRFSRDALRGATFIDPTAEAPYFFHLGLLRIVRKADQDCGALRAEEPLECRLVGLRQDSAGRIEECPVEHLLLLRGGPGGIPLAVRPFTAHAPTATELAARFAREQIAAPLAERHRAAMLANLPERERFIETGYRYEEDNLLAQRVLTANKAREGDPHAAAELERIKQRQRSLEDLKQQALAALRREPELIEPREIEFLAHALVVPSSDPEDKKRHDAEIEKVAVRIATEYERQQGWAPRDVSTPELARAAGLTDNPGFDILSNRPAFGATSAKSTVLEERAIEVKGRAGIGDIELTENEWSRACNLRDRYWLYVVYHCGTPTPRLFRVQDPFKRLIATAKGGVLIDEAEILRAADAV
jgi:superfamily II DNA or RNA helicase/transcriptional regulator with XRE-family HTH domain